VFGWWLSVVGLWLSEPGEPKVKACVQEARLWLVAGDVFGKSMAAEGGRSQFSVGSDQ